MSLLETEMKLINSNIVTFGDGLLVEISEHDNNYFIRGNYEIKYPIIHHISKLTEINGTEYMCLKVPNQKVVSDIMVSMNNRVKEKNWFTSSQEQGQEEFTKFEKHLRKALAEFEPNHNSKLGLIGELYILNSLLIKAHSGIEEEIIDAWTGHTSKSRDFIFRECCVEVKTTTKSVSSHIINNLNQVDPRDDDGGITELFLASIGVKEDETGDSIVSLTSSILERIADNALKTKFLDRVRNYGVHSIGYDHERMANWSQFQGKYLMSFIRFYDMSDTNIKVMRFSDLSTLSAVVERTVSFQINLDSTIHGSPNNPLNLDDFIEHFLRLN